jgi:hypothetical protein
MTFYVNTRNIFSYLFFARKRWLWSIPKSIVSTIVIAILTGIIMIIGFVIIYLTAAKQSGMFLTHGHD